MCAYISQQRKTVRPSYPSVYRNGAQIIRQSDSFPGSVAPIQTVTSWRTHDDVDSATDSDLEGKLESAIHGPKSGASWNSGSRISSLGDNGHTFETLKQEFQWSQYRLKGTGASAGYSYEGPVYPDPLQNSLGGTTYVTGSTPDSGYYGPAAIRNTIPTSPHANLAVGLAELQREGFPHVHGKELMQERAKLVRASGSEYLNHVFGWLPLLSDIRSAAQSVKNSSKLLEDFARGSGKITRRRFEFEPTTSIQTRTGAGSVIPSQQNNAAFRSAFVGGTANGTLTEELITNQRVWFSGAYTYHAAIGTSVLEQMKGFEEKVNILFGTRVTPEVVWNLAPWSWLSDWYANVGVNIANASQLTSDGLVLRYGYLMMETITDHTCTVTGPTLVGGSSGSFSVNFRTVRKQRLRATPYGFGSNPASFTTRQWAILGALGLTRAPKILP